MKTKFNFLFFTFLAGLILSSCYVRNNNSYDQPTLYDDWISFQNDFYSENSNKIQLIQKLVNIKFRIENYFSLDANSYSKNRDVNSVLIVEIPQAISELINLLNSDSDEAFISKQVEEINQQIFNLEHNEFLSLKQTNFQFVQFFELLVICCIFIVGFLIYFNNKELRKKQNQIDVSKKYLKYVIKIQEDERSRIARELHDTIAQDMRYVGLLLGKLPENEIIKDVQKYQTDCINQIRNLCYNFAPPDIKSGNLENALQTLVTETVHKSNLDLRLTILDNVNFSVFNQEELLHLYRIVQESITNIEKHAQASEATILFRCNQVDNKKRIYKLVITDDGIGIKPDLIENINSKNISIKKADGNHFGITGIKERVLLLNGTIEFNSIPDEGTEIVISIEK